MVSFGDIPISTNVAHDERADCIAEGKAKPYSPMHYSSHVPGNGNAPRPLPHGKLGDIPILTICKSERATTCEPKIAGWDEWGWQGQEGWGRYCKKKKTESLHVVDWVLTLCFTPGA